MHFQHLTSPASYVLKTDLQCLDERWLIFGVVRSALISSYFYACSQDSSLRPANPGISIVSCVDRLSGKYMC